MSDVAPEARSKFVGLSLVGALTLTVFLQFWVDGTETPSNMALFIGRFHPSLVHLPIGILSLAVLFEVASRRTGTTRFDRAIPAILLLGAWGAIAAVIAGLFISLDGSYDGDTLMWHRRLGMAVAILASLAYLARASSTNAKHLRTTYVGLLAALFLAISIGGHMGGQLTHGAGYLTRYMPDGLRSLVGVAPQAEPGGGAHAGEEAAERDLSSTYTAAIRPILNDRCMPCHTDGEGGLYLDTPGGIMDGGDTAVAVVPGNPARSEIIRRITLPLSHGDHMPPEEEAQLTIPEAALLHWWIENGAEFEQPIADAPLPSAIHAIFQSLGIDPDADALAPAPDVPAADPAALEAAHAAGLTVSPIAADGPFLQARCTSTANCGAAQLTALRPLARQVAWLDLRGAPIDDASLSVVSELEHLTRLHLERTSITDGALAHLQGLQRLEYLNLYGTDVSDDGIARLAELPALQAVFLWQTGVTEVGAQSLREARPGVEVNLGGQS